MQLFESAASCCNSGAGRRTGTQQIVQALMAVPTLLAAQFLGLQAPVLRSSESLQASLVSEC
jgi:hypothetical protein